MTKFKISPKPMAPAVKPASIAEFGASAALAKSQAGGRSLKPVRLNLDLDPGLHRRLKFAAVEAGVPASILVRQWIEAGLSK